MVNSITSNGAATSAQTNINVASNRASAAISRLSSGDRITRASDDVAGLATGTSLRTQITSLRTALGNAAQGTSLLQVADGSLSQIVDILQRQKAITVQAGSGSLTDTNRSLLNQEFQALTSEVNRIAASTNFNGVSLLAGGLGITSSIAATTLAAQQYFTDQPVLNSGILVSQSRNIIEARTFSSGNSTGRIIITDNTGSELADGAFANVNSAVYGQFSKFELSDFNYGAGSAGSATLTATLNGTKFLGRIDGGGTGFTISNGNTNIFFNAAVFVADLLNVGTASATLADITNDASGFILTRTSSINGVNFEGTALDGVIGNLSTGGVVKLRLASNGAVQISNFRYESNAGAADTSILTVSINGKTFTATTVSDVIVGEQLSFIASNGAEMLMLDLNGLTTSISNIRTNLADRQAFIDALNTGFARAGGGLNFNVGSTTTDTINIRYGSATTVSIYGGQSLDVASATNAAVASTVLDNALNQVISLRATVGALQSRFDFASASIQSSIESQDLARGSLLDTDVAAESTNFASAQVQLQAGIAILAQANRLPSNLLGLLEGTAA